MLAVEIREAEPTEHAAIDALATAAWQTLKAGYDPHQWENLLVGVGRMSALAADGTLLVAIGAGILCGAVGYMPPGRSNPKIFPPSWPSIRMLVVHPDQRGHGIGKALTLACIDAARKDGADCIGLHTSEIMQVAQPMYMRMGFVRQAELPPIAGAPYARYVLAL
jgi:ribosomal protein S18 acetylase RimI-like enzyme